MSISGSIPTTISYYHEVTLSLPAEDKRVVEVSAPGKTNKGSFIFSWGIGLSTMVVAKLSNQEFAIYHAAIPVRECQGFREFFNQFQKDEIAIQELYVFQKIAREHAGTVQEKLQDTAAVLSVTLHNYLIENPKFKADGLEIQLRRIQGDNYTGIICDSLNNCIILCNELNKKTEGELVDYTTNDTNKLARISLPVPFAEIREIARATEKRLTIDDPEAEGIIQNIPPARLASPMLSFFCCYDRTQSPPSPAEKQKEAVEILNAENAMQNTPRAHEQQQMARLASPTLSFFCCYHRIKSVSPPSEENGAAPALQGMK